MLTHILLCLLLVAAAVVPTASAKRVKPVHQCPAYLLTPPPPGCRYKSKKVNGCKIPYLVCKAPKTR